MNKRESHNNLIHFISFALHLVCASLVKTAQIVVIASSGLSLVYGSRYRILDSKYEFGIVYKLGATCVLIKLVRCGRVPPDIVDRDPLATASNLTDNFQNRSRHLLGNEPINEYGSLYSQWQRWAWRVRICGILSILLSLSYDFPATRIDPASNSVGRTCNVLRCERSEIEKDCELDVCQVKSFMRLRLIGRTGDWIDIIYGGVPFSQRMFPQ